MSSRESVSFDVVIVGAGPAGLAAAIRLKHLNTDLSVAVLEKGAEVGAHILSGAVVDPIGIDQLLPGWRDEAIGEGRTNDDPIAIENAWRGSAIGQDLARVRNVNPSWSRFGTGAAIILGGMDMWANTLFGVSSFGIMRHRKSDAEALEPANQHAPISYPRPDGALTFDRMSSVYLSNTNHSENQPVHLKLADIEPQARSERDVYAGPSARYFPAGVYEWSTINGKSILVINAQNCVHCKTCDNKDPNGNIARAPPQGGEGPDYSDM